MFRVFVVSVRSVSVLLLPAFPLLLFVSPMLPSRVALVGPGFSFVWVASSRFGQGLLVAHGRGPTLVLDTTVRKLPEHRGAGFRRGPALGPAQRH